MTSGDKKTWTIAAESRNGAANARKSRLPLSTFVIDLDRYQPIGMTLTERKKNKGDAGKSAINLINWLCGGLTIRGLRLMPIKMIKMTVQCSCDCSCQKMEMSTLISNFS